MLPLAAPLGLKFLRKALGQAARVDLGPTAVDPQAHLPDFIDETVEAIVVKDGKGAHVVDVDHIVPDAMAGAFRSYRGMLNRCTVKSTGDGAYFGRTKLCTEWTPKNLGNAALRQAFLPFFQELGMRPDGMSIDRIDNYGHYVPGNVRWATGGTQRGNQR